MKPKTPSFAFLAWLQCFCVFSIRFNHQQRFFLETHTGCHTGCHTLTPHHTFLVVFIIVHSAEKRISFLLLLHPSLLHPHHTPHRHPSPVAVERWYRIHENCFGEFTRIRFRRSKSQTRQLTLSRRWWTSFVTVLYTSCSQAAPAQVTNNLKSSAFEGTWRDGFYLTCHGKNIPRRLNQSIKRL